MHEKVEVIAKKLNESRKSILEELLDSILRKRSQILSKGFKKDLKLEIYMEVEIWENMMEEPHTGSTLIQDLYYSNGKSIGGIPIYKVLEEGYGVKVLEA